jgi:DNA-binding MarR family transcriptional regulator
VQQSIRGQTDVAALLARLVVALTEAGVRRLAEAAPIHLRQVNELFVAKLSDVELSTLASALDKVGVDCTFG